MYMTTPYDDIIDLPHYEPHHKRMTMEARAAQFAPFAALTGHDAAIVETARTTTSQINLSADELQSLSQKIAYALSFANRPELDITYFKPDTRKKGGAYCTIHGTIKKIEECYNLLTLTDGTEIPLDTISDITSEIFNDLEPM